MTGEPNPNPKKLKIDSGLKADGRVTITTSQEATSKDASYGTFFEGNLFFIELQGEQSVDRKLNSVFAIGDKVVLIKNMPEDEVYKGSLCKIIDMFGGNDHTFYEIQFESEFPDNDLSRRSQKRHSDFEFPSSVYVTIVSEDDIVRLVTQDLLYKTCFP